ncbi:putative caspase-like protein [Tardiphaga robiniae]|uniref:caspase domain-containing protein n=1 Tax=Tardiphaga robiniae TaxID=943830 RepID=UPI00285BE8CE|nr:caspase domain-containing protein [Tardiphaga robiniae]MDR6662750.1 putative caspase-like protein [Tardiphaga robiniae]
MVRPVICSAIVAATVMLGSQAAWAESRLALVIGQSSYRSIAPLPNPVNDAKAMAQMLGDAGFEVQSATDLSQTDLRARIAGFAANVSAKGPDTVALVFYAGHGLQIDGENYLVPVDIDPKREADIPLQAVRLNDILNTLTSVPSKSRIILLDACRNNPFPAISKTTGRGLAQVDVKFGTPGTLLSFSTSPGAEAEDGKDGNSPYTTALLKAGREPGLPIEDAFKRVRLSVNQATEGRQTPWESSSLVNDFRFFGTDAGAKPAATKKTVDQWRKELQGKPVQDANNLIVSDGAVEAYEAFVGLYAEPPLGPQAKEWLDRHYKMVAWNNAVITNTAPSYRDFLAKYPDSDLTSTAQKLEERTRNKPVPDAVANAPTNVALAGPGLTCPCGAPPAAAPASKKAEKTTEPTKKRADRPSPPPRRSREIVEEEVIIRRAPPVYYEPLPRVYYGGGGYGGYGGGNYGGRGRY